MAASSRFAVAVHTLAVIACCERECCSSRKIAGSVATNPVVIRRLLCLLTRAGLVEPAYGTHGGFRLARPPSQITLYDVYRAVEDGGFFALREKTNAKCPVACCMKEALRRVFAGVESRVLPELRRTTLVQIVGRVPGQA